MKNTFKELDNMGWEDFKVTAAKALGPPMGQLELRTRLLNLVQSGTAHEYNFAFRQIAGQITEMAFLDQLMYDVEGLKSMPAREVRRCYHNLHDLEMAMTLAADYDFALNKERTTGDIRNKINHVQSEKRKLGQKTSHPAKTTIVKGDKKTSTTKIKKLTEEERKNLPNNMCARCRSTDGHWAKECPLNESDAKN
eukprot:Rmarinus@m.23665